MLQPRVDVEYVPRLCGGCRTPLGHVALQPGAPHLVIETRQFTGQVNIPVSRPCGRCGATNQLTSANLERWTRRGGGRPLLASLRRAED